MGRLKVVDAGERKEFRSIYHWNGKLTVPRKDVVFDGDTPYEAITTASKWMRLSKYATILTSILAVE